MATVITNTNIGAGLAFNGSPLKLVAQEQLRGNNYIVVYGKNNTSQQNGFELISKYNFAKIANPNGQPKSETNRFVIFLAPGRYDFSAGMSSFLDLDTPYIDIISLSGETDVTITSFVTMSPITVSTSDIRLRGINLVGQSIQINGTYNNVYFENIIGGDYNFSGPNTSGSIAGNFKNCIGGNYSFGDTDNLQTTSSSTFENCTAGDYSFGDVLFGSILKNCTAGFQSFGSNSVINSSLTDCQSAGDSFGTNSTITNSTFINCNGGSYCFGRTNGNSAIYNSTFKDCSTLEGSFSNYIENSTFLNCKATNNSFGNTQDINLNSEIYSSTFTNCKSGDYSFGVKNNGDVTFTNCIAGPESFGADIASAIYKNCTSGLNSFGSGTQGWSTLQAGGYFYNCVVDDGSFGTNFANGEFHNCISSGNGAWLGNAQGGMGGFAMGCKGMNPNGPGTAIYCLDAGANPINFGLPSTTNNI